MIGLRGNIEKELFDVGVLKSELRSGKDRSVLMEDAIIDKGDNLAGQKPVDDASRWAVWTEQPRHDDIGVEDHSHDAFRPFRAAAISLLISSTPSWSAPD